MHNFQNYYWVGVMKDIELPTASISWARFSYKDVGLLREKHTLIKFGKSGGLRSYMNKIICTLSNSIMITMKQMQALYVDARIIVLKKSCRPLVLVSKCLNCPKSSDMALKYYTQINSQDLPPRVTYSKTDQDRECDCKQSRNWLSYDNCCT